MAKLIGAQRMVLQATLDAQGETTSYIADTKIAEATQIAIKDVRDWLETLEGNEYVSVARTKAGLSASVTANGRLALGQFRPFSSSTPGPAPLPTTKPPLSPMGPSGTSSLASTKLPDAQPTAPRQAIPSYSHKDPESRAELMSYSLDSEDHRTRLELADALRGLGINGILDQYIHPAPEEGWPRWMNRSLDEAQFVLMVCTETYRRRVMDREEPGKGLGVRWEGSLIYNRIYNDKPSGSRFIPILLLPGSEPAHIPNPVQGHPTIGSRRSTSPTRGSRPVPAPDRPGTYASARPRQDHDLTTETEPRILPGPSLTPSTTGGDASGGS